MSSTPPPANPGTGEAIVYCTAQKTFVGDLDSQAQSLCTAAGYQKTGTYCCGEPEDGEEYYSDTAKGCWSGTVKNLNTMINSKVLLDGTKFKGCALDTSLQNLQNAHTSQPLIEPQSVCTIAQGYFCSNTGHWNQTGSSPRSALKQAPNSQSSECCAPSQCWNGTACKNDQFASAGSQNHMGPYRCMQGEWLQRSQKLSPTNQIGFCPIESQCLFNPTGNSADNGNPNANPQCINNSQFKGNNLCMNGNWSTRTKEAALELLRMEGRNNYTIFCDSPSKILNKGGVNFETAQLSLLQSKIETPCVLIKGQKTIVAMPFTRPPTDNEVETLLGSSCAHSQSSGTVRCADKLYRNNRTQVYFMSNQNLGSFVGQEKNLAQMIVAIINFIRGKVTNGEPLQFDIQGYYESLEDFPSFTKLYVSEVDSAQNEQRRIFGVYKESGSSVQTLITYTNFDDDVCATINDFTQRSLGQTASRTSGIACTRNGKEYTVVMEGSTSGGYVSFLPETWWEDFTAKVRMT
jgi:hypothetical protein